MSIELEIRDLMQDGSGLGVAPDASLYLVPGALPHERWRFEGRVEQGRGGLSSALDATCLVAAPERQAPACSAFPLCGGCQLRHLRPEAQSIWRAESTRRTLARIGDLVLPSPLPIWVGDSEAYRNKVVWQLDIEAMAESRRFLGFYQRGSHQMMETPPCLLLDLRLRALDTALHRLARSEGDFFRALQAVMQIEARVGDEDCQLTFHLRSRDLRQDFIRILSRRGFEHWALELLRLMKAELAEIGEMNVRASAELQQLSLHVAEPRGRGRWGGLQRLAGQDAIQISLGPSTFEVLPLAFFQVNTIAATAFLDWAADELRKLGRTFSSILDWYAGVGTLSIALAKRLGQDWPIWGFDLSEEAVVSARRNAVLNGLKADFVCTDASKAKMELQRFDRALVLVDPPRSGMDQTLREMLLEVGPDHVLYLSCHPATLARDLKILTRSYAVRAVRCFDFFPQTCHVETVCLMTRV